MIPDTNATYRIGAEKNTGPNYSNSSIGVSVNIPLEKTKTQPFVRAKRGDIGDRDANLRESIREFQSTTVLGKTAQEKEHQLTIDRSKLPGSSYLETAPDGSLIAINIDS